MIAIEHSARNTATYLDDIPIDLIHRSDLNPRTHFDEEAITELAESIRQHGVMQPIVVRPSVDDWALRSEPVPYIIVAGERRWRAAQLAGLTTIPAIIRPDLTDADHLRLALIENLIRQDLDPIEEARGYQRLNAEVGLTQKQIAADVNRSQPAIANSMRLLDLPEEIRAQISARTLSVSHGLALLKWRAFPGVMIWLAGKVVDEGWSSKTLENWKPSTNLPDDLGRPLGQYRAIFDQSVCQQCPFNARKQGEYGQEMCLNPAHWQELQDAARAAERAKDAATNARAQAAIEAGVPRLQDLRGASPIGQYTPAPAGCTAACPCRVQAVNRDGVIVECCTDWQRQLKLQGEEREAKKAAKAAKLGERSAVVRAAIDGLGEVTTRELVPIVAARLRYLNLDVLRSATRHLGEPLSEKALGKLLKRGAEHELAEWLSSAGMTALVRFALETTLGDAIHMAYREWGDEDEGAAGWYLNGAPIESAPSAMVACALCQEPTFAAEGVPVEINGRELLACAACGEVVEENQESAA